MRRAQAEKQRAYDEWVAEKQEAEKQWEAAYEAAGMSGLRWKHYRKEQEQNWMAAHKKPSLMHTLPTFSLSSPVQVVEALDELGIPVSSSSKDALEIAAVGAPWVRDLISWKKAQTIRSFCAMLPEHLHPDGRLHPDFHLISSGRFATAGPNLQGVPKQRDGESNEEDPRRCIVAAPGHLLLSADLSNIELRILAEVSEDPTMLRLFAEGKDLHAETARLMFHLGPDVDPKKHTMNGVSARAVAKTINFGIAYGMGAATFAYRLGVSLEEAKGFVSTYRSTYKKLANYLYNSGKDALQRGYAVTLAGRRRYYLPPSEDELSAKNHPIQGTSADILKRAMVLLYERLPEQVSLILTIHDEVVLECPGALVDEASSVLQTALMDACRTYLHTVEIPLPEVTQATYWKKD